MPPQTDHHPQPPPISIIILLGKVHSTGQHRPAQAGSSLMIDEALPIRDDPTNTNNILDQTYMPLHRTIVTLILPIHPTLRHTACSMITFSSTAPWQLDGSDSLASSSAAPSRASLLLQGTKALFMIQRAVAALVTNRAHLLVRSGETASSMTCK